MKTVHEVCELTKMTPRTLHYYDAIGLLKPTTVTEASYRLYDEAALEKFTGYPAFSGTGISAERDQNDFERSEF